MNLIELLEGFKDYFKDVKEMDLKILEDWIKLKGVYSDQYEDVLKTICRRHKYRTPPSEEDYTRYWNEFVYEQREITISDTDSRKWVEKTIQWTTQGIIDEIVKLREVPMDKLTWHEKDFIAVWNYLWSEQGICKDQRRWTSTRIEQHLEYVRKQITADEPYVSAITINAKEIEDFEKKQIAGVDAATGEVFCEVK